MVFRPMRRALLFVFAALMAVLAVPASASASDSTPPSLKAFSFAPSAIDTSTFPQEIAFNARITDDGSGVAGRGSRVVFAGPTGQVVKAPFGAATRVSGTALDGAYRSVGTVPQGAEDGTWTVQRFVLVDAAGNTETLSAADLTADGFPTTFTNTAGTGRELAVVKRGSGDGTVTSDPVGIECGTTCATDFGSGSDVTLTATPDASSRFVGWGGACAGSTPTCQVTVSQATTVRARFAIVMEWLHVRVVGHGTVTSSPPGLRCSSDCAHRFPIGVSVQLIQRAASGWHFLAWGRACAGAASCAVDMDGTRWVKAMFPPDVAPLGARIRSFIASRSDRVGVAVYDRGTGTTFVDNPHGQFNCGSIVKVQIMGTVLRRAQQAGRGLTSYERSNMRPMIELSDNNAATNLWNEVGQASGVESFDRLAGMDETTTSSAWGMTSTTAWDNVRLVRDYAYPSPALDARWRDYGLYLMEHVVGYERWGVSAGPTAGTTVALKNGWLPLPDARVWRINSIGWIDGHGRNYVIAVLTDHNASESYGIRTVETVSRMVWDELG